MCIFSNKKIISGSLPFSLKSESVTVANLSPYRGMLDFAKAMKIDWNAEEDFIRLSKPFNGPIEQKAKFKLIVEMYTELKKEIVEKTKDSNFSKQAYAFLRKSIFGLNLFLKGLYNEATYLRPRKKSPIKSPS